MSEPETRDSDWTMLEGGCVEVLTFKEGLLSKVAHDLLLRMQQFEVQRAGAQVRARFHPASLSVECAMRDGQPERAALGGSDKREIEENIRQKVLHTDRHPVSMYEGRAEEGSDGYQLEGHLTLKGRSQPLRIHVRRHQGRLTGSVVLTPSQFGIPPFKALLGAIRLQDRVLVRFDFPDPA